MTEEAVGSRYYMHPELEDGRITVIKPYHDLYSLGKVIYWIFLNRRMFAREKFLEEGWNLAVFEKFENHFDVRPEMEHINAILKRLITRDKRKTFNSINEVI